jgi:hypothetical protein
MIPASSRLFLALVCHTRTTKPDQSEETARILLLAVSLRVVFPQKIVPKVALEVPHGRVDVISVALEIIELD